MAIFERNCSLLISAVFVYYFPTQRIVILEYQTFNLLAVQMGYGKPMGIESKALRTIYFVS